MAHLHLTKELHNNKQQQINNSKLSGENEKNGNSNNSSNNNEKGSRDEERGNDGPPMSPISSAFNERSLKVSLSVFSLHIHVSVE